MGVRLQVPKEIIYVQKLHFWGFLLSLIFIVSLIVFLLFSMSVGLITFIVGLILSYGVTVRKQTFIIPSNETIARNLAQKLTCADFCPKTAASAATELFYLLGDESKAENLLLAYLPCDDPLVHTTLADIYIIQNKLQHAMNCLEPVKSSENPLVEWTYGKIFMRQSDYLTAVKHLDIALSFIRKNGLPNSKTGLLTSKFIKWSVKASIHHDLADCYHQLGEMIKAKKFLRRGNRYLIDFSLWRLDFGQKP